MAKEIIINAEKEQTRIAIVEKGDLAELYFENPDNARTLGDIYLGRIRRIMPSIKAAFVDIGQKQDAFLHFSDLAENLDALLEYVDQDNPQVQVVHRMWAKRTAEPQRSVGKRRKPRHGKGPSKSDGDGKSSDEKHHHVADAQTRGKRRSAQRRAKHRHDDKEDGADDQQTERRGRRHSSRGPQRGSPDWLKRNQRILVKIVKEPISNKGSRVSSNISLAGRFLVLVPLADYTAVSKKITSPKERRRLRALAKMLLPEGFGVIVRTVAEGKDAKSLDTDLRLLLEQWRKIERKLAGRPGGPTKVHEDVNMASSIIRDLFSDDYDRILVDQQRMYRNIKNYIQAVAPQMASAVQLHKGKKHIFDSTDLKNDIDEVFESRVDLPSGGYLFIERTEAMHVIDVNSGRSGRGMNQEENSLKVNLEAARVLARQVRLRDLGGIIVVDFIDMREERNKKKVYEALKTQFRDDRAVTKTLPMSDFGLMQITRQRLRPSITTTFAGPDATTNGTSDKQPDDTAELMHRSRNRPPRHKQAAESSVPPSAVVSPKQLIKDIETWIGAYKAGGRKTAVKVYVHPFTAAYLNKGFTKQSTRWWLKHRLRIRLEADDKLHPMAYRCVDSNSGKDVTDLKRLEENPSPKQQASKRQPKAQTRQQSKNQSRQQSKNQPKQQSKNQTRQHSKQQQRANQKTKNQSGQHSKQQTSQEGEKQPKANQKPKNQPKQQKSTSRSKGQARQQSKTNRRKTNQRTKNQPKQQKSTSRSKAQAKQQASSNQEKQQPSKQPSKAQSKQPPKTNKKAKKTSKQHSKQPSKAQSKQPQQQSSQQAKQPPKPQAKQQPKLLPKQASPSTPDSSPTQTG